MVSNLYALTQDFIELQGDSINGGMEEMAEMVGFQFVMFIATLILYEFMYRPSSIIL